MRDESLLTQSTHGNATQINPFSQGIASGLCDILTNKTLVDQLVNVLVQLVALMVVNTLQNMMMDTLRPQIQQAIDGKLQDDLNSVVSSYQDKIGELGI